MTNIFRAFALLALALASHISPAQNKVYFCSNYTSTGEPSGTSYSWEIKPAGGIVSLLYKQGSGQLASPVIYIYIDKRDGESYRQVATQRIVPVNNRDWVAYDHTFYEPGNYKVTFLDHSRKELATGYCSIVLKRKGISSDYYAGSRIRFCSYVTEEGVCDTPQSSFYIDQSGSYVNVIVEHTGELKTNELIVDVWTGDDFRDYVETSSVNIDPGWVWTKFQQTFYAAGTYKLKVYTKDEVYINSSVVTISYLE